MKLGDAVLCLDCDEVWDVSERRHFGCPKCSNRMFLRIKKVLLPMEFYKDALEKQQNSKNAQSPDTGSNKKIPKARKM
mgnify:CR=1 FL=1